MREKNERGCILKFQERKRNRHVFFKITQKLKICEEELFICMFLHVRGDRKLKIQLFRKCERCENFYFLWLEEWFKITFFTHV